MTTNALRLGTRGSWLAMMQSSLVAERLRRFGFEVELVEIVTGGDRRAAGITAGEGMFVTALEEALVAGEVDLAVHSAKDVPLKETEAGLVIAAFPERGDPRDALVSARGGATLETLPPGAVFGTDSPRRAGFVLSRRRDLRQRPMSGNVDTRLRKLGAGEVDALVLAAAGLDRLGMRGRIDERLAPDVMPPAPGQGALAAQCRAGDARVREALARIDVPEVRLAVLTERRVLEATGGTCRAPVGALAGVGRGCLRLLAAAASPDGSERHLVVLEAEPTEAAGVSLAARAGEELLKKVVSLSARDTGTIAAR
jgi:hydroxymethylbilane synthase